MKTQNTKTNVNCEVYVGTYAKYNNGSIAGKWVDLTAFEDYDEFIDYCKELHHDEPEAEFMFQDSVHDYVFKDMIGEHGIDKKVFDAIQEYAELEDWQQEVLCAYMDASGLDFFEALSEYEDKFITDNLSDYAYEIVQEYNIPEFALRYFDYYSFEKDLEMDFLVGTCNGKDFYFQY